jgi:ABC-type Na+ efflux pump permease subunit
VTGRRRSVERRVRNVARIARWEAGRTSASVDRTTAVLALVTVLLGGAVATGAVATGGVALGDGIYRVGLPAEDPYREAAVANDRLAVRTVTPEQGRQAVREGDLELAVAGNTLYVADSRKGEAALAAFRSAVQAHNDRLMAAESNRSAAYPVVVTLRYVSRASPLPGAERQSDGTTGNSVGGDGPGDAAGGGASAGSGDGTGTPTGTASATNVDGQRGSSGGLPVPGVGGMIASSTTGSPADISPPFPFSSLVLAFVFLVPMNFVIQAYGSTILNERINRRGELLLVSPVTPGDIVAGKTLPYVGATLLLTTLVAVGVGGSTLSVLAVLPVGLLFLAATFVGAMFARSFKELTFVTVAVSVFLTSYTFVPAIFTDVTPVALISPLTLVVRDLQGQSVALGEFAFATLPFAVAAGVLFLLGTGVYREEDMFTQRPVPLKFLDALDSRLGRPRSVAVMSALTIPFVFIAELLAIAVLFAVPVDFSIPVLLVLVAAVEEVAKSVHVYAGFAKDRFARTWRTALVVGGLSGVGFFLGEKFTAVVQLVGLSELLLGRTAFAPAGVGLASTAALLVAPLVLHAVTAAVSALGASRNRTWYAVAVTLAMLIHAAYNLTVVSVLG